jgi:transcription-repair coupling factor (superfamily II helicase)
MYEEFGFWSKEERNYIFAEPAPLFYERINWGKDTRRDRMETLVALAQGFLPNRKGEAYPQVIFTSVKSLMTRTIPRRDFLLACSTLKTGSQTQVDALCRKWQEIGYSRTELVTASGQFSRRGGLVDIWPIHMENPVRVDFFGDEVDSIRTFDPASQRSIQVVPEVFLPPAGEVLGISIIRTRIPACACWSSTCHWRIRPPRRCWISCRRVPLSCWIMKLRCR